MSLARRLLVAAIHGYKRHLSPHKGYACAFRVHTGGCSCSTLGLRAISRYGAWRGLGVLRLRLAECRRVAQSLRTRPFIPRQAQAGFVDCAPPCDASCVDVSSCSVGDACSWDGVGEAFACLDWVSCCDWGSCGSRPRVESRWGRRRRREEPAVWQPGPGSAGQPRE